MSELQQEAPYVSECDEYGGAVILVGRDKCNPILAAMVLAQRDLCPLRTLGIFFRDKAMDRTSLNLSTLDGVQGLETISSLDYLCVGASDTFNTPYVIPSMSRTIREVVTGEPNYAGLGDHIKSDEPNQLCKLLSNLSHLGAEDENDPIKGNFASHVKTRIFDNIQGHYNIGLFLHSTRSNIILAHRGNSAPPILALTITRDCVAVLWFSNVQGYSNFKHHLAASQEDTGIIPLTIDVAQVRDSVAVIHPIHLASKWIRSVERSPSKNPKNQFVSLNIIAKHLRQSMLPLI